MPVSERTIKILFAKSGNRCAMPDCRAALVVGDNVLGEVCHIRARRKNGPRHDPNLTEEQKSSAANLVLLCGTCHTLIDKDKSGEYSVVWLERMKASHEQTGIVEITPGDARSALAILAKHLAKEARRGSQNDVRASANGGAVAIAIGGTNQGNIHIRMLAAAKNRGYPTNSIGADANLSGYVDYLFELYAKYMSPIETDQGTLWGRLGRDVKTKFRLAKRTRYHLPAERFIDLVEFLISKLAVTPVGKKHLKRGTKLCASFDEWRTTIRGA